MFSDAFTEYDDSQQLAQAQPQTQPQTQPKPVKPPQSQPRPQQRPTRPHPKQEMEAPEWVHQVGDRIDRIVTGIRYKHIFWFGVVPVTGVLLLSAVFSQSPQLRLINTPASQEAKVQEMENAIKIVLKQPIRVGDQEVIVSDPKARMDAAAKVLEWQEKELIQRKTVDLSLKISAGMADPGHICYKLGLQSCVAKLREQQDQRRTEAYSTKNLDQLLLIAATDRAIDRVAANKTTADQFDFDLNQIAVAQYRAAQIELDQASPGGEANRILNRVMEEGQK